MAGNVAGKVRKYWEMENRAEEARVIGHVLGRPAPCVLSCGGGAVLHPGTRRALAGPDSDVVYLAVGEEEALRRVGGGAGRPVLEDAGITTITEALRLTTTDVRRLGDDVTITASVRRDH